MSFLDRALELVRRPLESNPSRARTADQHATGAAASSRPTPTLREFLARRLISAERAFERQGDLTAHAEMRLCRVLLQRPYDEAALFSILEAQRADRNRWVRAASLSLWAGWHASGGQFSAASAEQRSPSGTGHPQPERRPRCSTSRSSSQIRASSR